MNIHITKGLEGTYSANHCSTLSTFSYQISCAISHFPVAMCTLPAFYEIIVCGSRSIAQCTFGVQFYILVHAVESGRDELGAELEKVHSDLSTCAGECIEGIEVDMRCYDGYDPAKGELDYSY